MSGIGRSHIRGSARGEKEEPVGGRGGEGGASLAVHTHFQFAEIVRHVLSWSGREFTLYM